MKTFVLCFLLVSPLLTNSLPVFLRRKWQGRDGMLRSFTWEEYIPPSWFNQNLDHFNPSINSLWKQRYWVNDTFWEETNGPVFLFIGGEGEANPSWIVEGEMMDLAQKYKAMAVLLEHRFYGQSQPAADLSVSSLRFLSSEQALADLANFHDFIVKEYSMTDSNRWISFGGSYPGALSAWLRIKYPHIVYGALASSAPVQAELDFYQYLVVVGQSLLQARNGRLCVSAIGNAFNTLNLYIEDKSQWAMLDEKFKLSPKLESFEDSELLTLNLAGIFMDVVQYNNDSRGEGYDMSMLCDVMTNKTLGTPFDRLVYLSNVSNPTTQDCNFQNYLTSLNDSRIAASVGERQWFYQTCAEFGYFQTSDFPYQPFGSLISMNLYTDVCEKVFNITVAHTSEYVVHTNAYYGGKDINKNVTNIIFPNGSIDPWHALGIISNISDNIIAIYIEGTAHCANMYQSTPYDKPQLVEARHQIDAIIGGWLAQP